MIAVVNAKIASDDTSPTYTNKSPWRAARMFGPSTESVAQGRLFDEAEVPAATLTEAQNVVPLPAPVVAQKPARQTQSIAART